MGNHSMFLCGRPSGIEGVARILDFAGALSRYNTSENGEIADRRAIAADWAAIGLDIHQAMAAYHTDNSPGNLERQGLD